MASCAMLFLCLLPRDGAPHRQFRALHHPWLGPWWWPATTIGRDSKVPRFEVRAPPKRHSTSTTVGTGSIAAEGFFGEFGSAIGDLSPPFPPMVSPFLHFATAASTLHLLLHHHAAVVGSNCERHQKLQQARRAFSKPSSPPLPCIPALSATPPLASGQKGPGWERKEIPTIVPLPPPPLSVIVPSPDGNVIDCVPPHLQPAFDHSKKLRGQKPEVEPEPEERPKVDGASAAQGEAAEEEEPRAAGVVRCDSTSESVA
uniref:Uncharacterized protein n=1 Tax=Oryza sativa subsp. japonica TaxID=39947 RepID=Q5ZA68_ORYSJ|nr:hypothetical protein [Oryza sativa Japonica Group]